MGMELVAEEDKQAVEDMFSSPVKEIFQAVKDEKGQK
jgi:hypothetical protein